MAEFMAILERVMMSPEFQSGLTFLMLAFTATAAIIWKKYRKEMRHREVTFRRGSKEREGATTSRAIMAAVVLSMTSGAILAVTLAPVEIGRAAGIPELVDFSRNSTVVLAFESLAKFGVAVGAALHIRGWLRRRFGRWWELALAALMAVVFLIGALGPHLL